MLIQKIIILNFRSIVSAEIDLTNLNVITGLNDIGKSNLLKALNLFFNAETDFGKDFNFDEDYSFEAPVRNKKAKEIVIQLHVQPPNNYSMSEIIIWNKVWRKEGFVPDKEFRQGISGQNIPDRSKLHSWLNNLMYKYVPAVKSDVYFQNLLGDLHDTLSLTITDTLKKAGVDFIAKIKNETGNITLNLTKRLGLTSDLQLPSNLKELFKTLDFRTLKGNFEVSLQKRGDGIKTRHIPVILHFLSQQENRNRVQGSPRVNTIWGYEEPENNLELLKAYEVAKEFEEYSSEIQMLITTHSPAFYSLAKQAHHTCYFALLVNDKTEYQKIDASSFEIINENMGVLQIITPYIDKEVQKQATLNEVIRSLQNEIKAQTLPALYVEGITDKVILDAYCQINKPKRKMSIIASQDEGGVNFVHDRLMAWAYSGNKDIAMGLFDKDEAGGRYRDKLSGNEHFIQAVGKKKVAIIKYDVPSHLRNIYKQKIILPFSLEELFPPIVWQYAEKQNWLTSRENVRDFLNINIPHNLSLLQVLEKAGLSKDEQRYIMYKVKDNCKSPFAKYIAANISNRELQSGLETIMNKINGHL